jgi:hypothetical protein
MATRDIDFDVTTDEQVTELIRLCRVIGWVVDEKDDVFHYAQGISVNAHKPNFQMSEFDDVYAIADGIAEKVGGKVTGGGTSFGED